jgi:hypothetical protein
MTTCGFLGLGVSASLYVQGISLERHDSHCCDVADTTHRTYGHMLILSKWSCTRRQSSERKTCLATTAHVTADRLEWVSASPDLAAESSEITGAHSRGACPGHGADV